MTALGSWWVDDVLSSAGPPGLVAWIVVVIGSIVLHELAHGWAAIRLGDDTPLELGHMTWNPLVHLGGFSLVVFAIIGIAWGAMPVNPSRLRGRHASALVAAAGPAMNFALAIVSAVLFALWVVLAPKAGIEDPLLTNFERFFWFAVMLNLVLGLFNLAPVLPLDGGRIVAEYSAWYRDVADSENGRWVMLGAFILLFWFGGDLVFAVGREVGSFMIAVTTVALNAVVP